MNGNFKAWLGQMDMTISNDLRLVMAGMQHIDSRISDLQIMGYYICAVLTAIFIAILVILIR
jgi:hypothetical protein